MIIELLAPAGNLEKAKIAMQYGADAVYLAGQHFGLRSAADNFSLDEIAQVIQFAHERNKKVYLAVNAYLHDDELKKIPEYITYLDTLGPDAFICSDLGVMSTVQQFSDIPIHISTQASVLNSHHASLWKDLGARRVVVGRELSIRETAAIKNATGLEVEMFIHGAMCMAYSGHCGISTYVAKRDSNRGGCIQNCRFDYTLYQQTTPCAQGYFLSSKDLYGLDRLPELIQRGITSLKIEGRMKSNLYTASVVRAYSQAIKEYTQSGTIRAEFWKNELDKIPHRDYTSASLETPAGPESIYNEKSESGKEYKLAGTVLAINAETSQFAIQAKNRLYPGDTIEILSFDGETIMITISQMVNLAGQVLEVAQPNAVFWLPLQDGIEPRNVARIHRADPPEV